jgi:hypothetical protein
MISFTKGKMIIPKSHSELEFGAEEGMKTPRKEA